AYSRLYLDLICLIFLDRSIPTASAVLSSLSLHDALPICGFGPSTPPATGPMGGQYPPAPYGAQQGAGQHTPPPYTVSPQQQPGGDRKSTRLNSSHVKISYAVFCLNKKKCLHLHVGNALDR